MHHHDKFAHSPRDRRPPSIAPPHGANLRMRAAMMEPDPRRPGHYVFEHKAAPARRVPHARESDLAYFRRRSEEERAAAEAAAGAEARQAHRKLSLLYAQLSGASAARRERPRNTGAISFGADAAARARRHDALLDDALRQTFPASDPVSVALVN
jgi:hypothetical protein